MTWWHYKNFKFGPDLLLSILFCSMISPCGPRVRESSVSVPVGNGKHQSGHSATVTLWRESRVINSLCALFFQSQWIWYPNATIRRWNTQNSFILPLLWQFKFSQFHRNMRGFGNPEFRCLSPAPMKGSDFIMPSAAKFKCNFVVISVVHSSVKMTGSYFSEFRWDENCCISLHEYKDYLKTHPLPQYAQMINLSSLQSAPQMVLWRRVTQ